MGVLVLFYKCLSWLVFKTLPLIGLWNIKLKKGIDGRKESLSRIKAFREKHPDANVVWFHCASLGEFEQAVALIKNYRKYLPEYKIAVSFYSPSGFEPNQNNSDIDVSFYLPFDITKDLKQVTTALLPDKVIVVKYEFWYNFLNVINSQNIPLYLISAYFLPHQIFFKKWGGLHRKMLRFFNHIFVQDQRSKDLLATLNINNVSVTGDTRIDRALLTKKEIQNIPTLDNWLDKNKNTFVAGSTWKEDLHLLAKAYSDLPNIQWIIAPHNIDNESLEDIYSFFPKNQISLWSESQTIQNSSKNILVIDTIGLLKSIYQYADFVWIGGGFNRSGIHNLIEAAVFKNSIFIGPNYERFREAKDLIALGGVISISNAYDLIKNIQDKTAQVKRQNIIQAYIAEQSGATQNIWKKIEIN